MTGRIISAEEAARIGLINEVLSPERLIPRAHELAAELIENSPASLAATKQLLNSFAVDDLNADIQAAVDANADIRTTADFREGVTSFLEKRKPVWKS
jgi:methylglutaconyl-CoA hydratase